jgi:hypothetical protein
MPREAAMTKCSGEQGFCGIRNEYLQYRQGQIFEATGCIGMKKLMDIERFCTY